LEAASLDRALAGDRVIVDAAGSVSGRWGMCRPMSSAADDMEDRER
jgi:hypothetical protein